MQFVPSSKATDDSQEFQCISKIVFGNKTERLFVDLNYHEAFLAFNEVTLKYHDSAPLSGEQCLNFCRIFN